MLQRVYLDMMQTLPWGTRRDRVPAAQFPRIMKLGLVVEVLMLLSLSTKHRTRGAM